MFQRFDILLGMNTQLLVKIRKWVKETSPNADHLIRTGYWVERIYPKADVALVIAAITHDIERGFVQKRIPPSPEFKGAKWDDPVYDKWHSERSAKFVKEFLEKENADKKLIEKIVQLISHHEHGGWKEVDILKDADSISFLEINVPHFISKISGDFSKDDVKEKFDLMYYRISSPKAKKIAEPFYKNAIRKLNLTYV